METSENPSSGAIEHGGRQLQSAHFRLHSEQPDALSSLSVYQWAEASLLRRGLHEVSSEEKVSAQGVMGRTK